MGRPTSTVSFRYLCRERITTNIFLVLEVWELTKIFWLTRTHSLRYVLKNRETNKELFVVSIELLPTEEAKTQGVPDATQKLQESLKEEAGGQSASEENEDVD